MELESREPREVTINVRLRERERVDAERAAAKAGVTVSELVRAALRDATNKVLAGNP
jgi:predicted HicB family RNase H-like nuclease